MLADHNSARPPCSLGEKTPCSTCWQTSRRHEALRLSNMAVYPKQATLPINISSSRKLSDPPSTLCPRRRPSVVTEGYMRGRPCRRPTSYPPRTYLVSIPVHDYRCNLQCILRVVFKKNVFYRVLWPSPSPGFISPTLKNHGFFRVLGLTKGSGTENWTSCRPWCQHRANIGQDVGYMGQHKAKIGASLRQHRANIGQDVGYMGRQKG